MINRRRLLQAGSIVGLTVGWPHLEPYAALAHRRQATPGITDGVASVLDGQQPIDVQALVSLARERIELGVGWLQKMLRPIGTFYYVYYPTDDLAELRLYNEVRHAGTTYALYQAHGLLGDETSRMVADAAASYIERSVVPVRAAGRAYLDIQEGDTSLGGQALALVALLERRRVTGETELDDLIHDLATFLLWLEKDDRRGRYFFSFDHQSRLRLETPDVVFYPGEALLALTRLAFHFPDRSAYIEAAMRLATYLVYERDGDLPALQAVPRHDHWLTIALSDLYRLDPKDDYRTVVSLQAESMISFQFTSENGESDEIGGFRRDGPISNTSTATKGEALVAAWALARSEGDDAEEARIAEATQRTAQYQMRVQYTPENTSAFPQPMYAIGGWPGGTDDPSIRIDYVQHNLSVLIGLVHLIDDGDLPLPG